MYPLAPPMRNPRSAADRQWRIQDFQDGAPTPEYTQNPNFHTNWLDFVINQFFGPIVQRGAACYLNNFSRKLHENEILAGRGARTSRPLDPPMVEKMQAIFESERAM